MFATALRRHRGDGAFHDLEEGLLHALARYVARDRRVVGLAADLVDFVNVDDAALGTLDIVFGRLQQLRMMFSTSSPTYPASVRVVASAIVNGTSRMRASVCARSVLPEPVGPISRMFDFADSISLFLV